MENDARHITTQQIIDWFDYRCLSKENYIGAWELRVSRHERHERHERHQLQVLRALPGINNFRALLLETTTSIYLIWRRELQF